MLDARRGPEEQEPEEFVGEDELDLDADGWEEEDLEGLDEEQSDPDARAEKLA